MRRTVWILLLAAILLASPAHAQQVVFSRRVYAVRGATFQQLWTWSAPDRRLVQLTSSPRDHRNPSCSADGMRIVFESGEMDRVTRWVFDRSTGTEHLLVDVPPEPTEQPTSPSALRALGCDDSTWARSADGSRAVCAAGGQDLIIMDGHSGAEVTRVRFGQRDSAGEEYPPWPLRSTWSPDDRTLLVGTYGEGSSSTTPFLDFFLVDLASRTWTRAMKGNNPVWVPGGNTIVYETPRDLVPLGSINVWSAQLHVFDAGTHADEPLTDGVSNNVAPSLCGR